jgi:hypothetical protein
LRQTCGLGTGKTSCQIPPGEEVRGRIHTLACLNPMMKEGIQLLHPAVPAVLVRVTRGHRRLVLLCTWGAHDFDNVSLSPALQITRTSFSGSRIESKLLTSATSSSCRRFPVMNFAMHALT